MTIDIQALAEEAGLERRTPHSPEQWDEDDDLHIVGQDGVSLPFLRAFANSVLEAAADACDQSAREQIMMVTTALDDSERSVISRECAAAIRAMKATL